jgi:hypothetical protein
MKPTLEQYDEIGAELCFLCSRLSRLACRLGNETGVSKAPYKHISEAVRSLDKCKSVTEDLMFYHYPGLPREAITIFYRHPKNPQEQE